MLTSAISILCVPFATTFSAFAVIVAFYGFGLGSWFVLIPVLLNEHHGTESIGSSFGLVRVFQGVVTLVVPPLVGKNFLHLSLHCIMPPVELSRFNQFSFIFIGYSKDATGDYIFGFYFMAASMVIGSIITNFKPCIIRAQK